MKDIICRFKPNLISVFVGGGNTIANDEKSLTLFFDVLFDMINTYKQPETVVLYIAIRDSVSAVSKVVAEKYGFLHCDTSFIHEKKGYENPYYAFNQYPGYDERAKAGAVEFRTHPGNEGHRAIADRMFATVKDEIASKIPEGEFGQDYEFEEIVESLIPERYTVHTEPDFTVSYSGFNVRQQGECVSFSSAPGTGASFSAKVSVKAVVFKTEMCVESDAEKGELELCIEGDKTYRYRLDLSVNNMHSYEFDISDIEGEITAFRVSPLLTECMITLKSVELK